MVRFGKKFTESQIRARALTRWDDGRYILAPHDLRE
jgi:hypothetical protein